MESLPAIKEAMPILEHEPEEVMNEVKKVSIVLTRVVKEAGLSKKFGGEKEHLYYEAWQTVGGFFSYGVKTGEAAPVEINGVQGAKAKADLYNKEGMIVGGAEAYCMRDEKNWANKPFYQLASMAQTRAGSKAFRNKFAWVAVLGGYAPTPAEEMVDETKEMEAIKAESDKTTAIFHDKLVNSKTIEELKSAWGEVGKNKAKLMPEHIQMLENLKNEMKEKISL